MTRTLTALILGLLLGVGGTLLLRSPPLALSDLDALADLPPSSPGTAAGEAVVSAAAREGGRDFYQQLADASAAELASMITQAASEPRSTDRELALAVLLKRYSEIDATGAVRLAREARVTGTGLTAVYGAWARRSPAQALAALGTVDSPDDAADVALALIAALGNEAAAVDRVSAVLVARGEDIPFTNLSPGAAPVGPSPAFGRSALGLTAERWAALDPRHAMAVAGQVDDERVRRSLEAAALRWLARTAPEEAFGRLAALANDPERLPVLSGPLLELARSEPERVLAIARGLPMEVRRMAESMALQQLAEREPLAALRYVEQLPVGMERQNVMQLVARSYGKKDAAAAMAWARSLPEQQNILPSVLGGIAEQDPNRAIDLALELRSPMERQRALQFIAMGGIRQESSFETIANRLLTIDDPQLQNSFNVVGMWASRAPDRAMNWLLANQQDAPPNMYMQIGQQIAMRDPRNAASYTSQVPEAAREAWMQGVSQGYAQADPQGAIGWLAQFRGEPWYDRAAATVAMSVAQRDGAAAARLAEDLDTQRLGPQIASSWANHDPVAAAAWASERPNEQERTMAVRSVAGIWANNDPDAARQWALRLPQTVRDGALTPILTSTARRSPSGLDARVLNAFTSETARQQAVFQVVQTLANTDAAKARTIADTHLTDAGLRSQAERVLEAARTGAGRPTFGTRESMNIIQ